MDSDAKSKPKRVNEEYSSTTNSWLKIFENWSLTPAIKLIANLIINKCLECQTSPIDTILAEWRGESPVRCWRCQSFRWLARLFLNKIIYLPDRARRSFASNHLYVRSVRAAIRGVGIFGLRRPQPTFPPIAVVWNITDRCNLKCMHCYQDSSPSLGDQGQFANELSPSEALKVVDTLVKAGCAALSFSGGEPLLRLDFLEVAKRASQQGLFCTLNTNGTQIDHTVAQDLIKAGIEGVSISLESFNSAFHDEFCGVSGAHAAALRALEVCAENGNFKGLIVAMTLTNRNINDIPALFELAKEIGATRFYVSRILPVGRGKTLHHLNVTPAQRREVLEWLATRFTSYIETGGEIPVMTRGMTYFAPQCAISSKFKFFPISEIVVGFSKHHEERLGKGARYFFRELAEYAGGCATGLTYCGLSPEGNILPCAPATDMPLGNILTDGLENIWYNHPVFRTVRNRAYVEGKCGMCENKSICGGYRVTAYGKTGNWLASDPSCPY